MSMKPNLFIIGAAKSGTTSLHDNLASHPDIFMSDPKEPGFFVPELQYYPKDEAWYSSLFDNAGTAVYRGESSTHYTKIPAYTGVPERIAAFVDEAPRFIYVMRDPVQRALSHYWHNIHKQEEHRSIESAVREVGSYRDFGNYRMQLEPYVATFGRDSVYTMTFEALVGRPAETVSGLLEWLGLPEAPLQLNKKNARPELIRRVRGRGQLRALAHSAMWGRIAPYAPTWFRALGRQLSVRSVAPDEKPPQRVIEWLRAEMQPLVRDLEVYLGRDFPEWSYTHGSASDAQRTRTPPRS